MKLLDCTEFASKFTAKESKWSLQPEPWVMEIHWDIARENGYTHAIVNNKIYVIDKFGPGECCGVKTDYNQTMSF